MTLLDLVILILYLSAMLGVGCYFLRKNESAEDYYVGGRRMGSFSVGLSVVATDVGGGFSIGLGGLGFTMGLSGSWMLFTGLIGAWLAAVLLIPRVAALPGSNKFFTFPQVLNRLYAPRVALVAGIISGIGYAGFTSAQILAGAKLASSVFPSLNLHAAMLVMGAVIVLYTVFGGIKAVIYTDVVQWLILMAGLLLIGLPLGYHAVGGMQGLREVLPPEMLTFTAIGWPRLINWGVTIIPIWFVGMTLYQRMFACADVRTARRAWFLAGLFEWPVMAFMGVLLGLFARAAAIQGQFEILGVTSASALDPEKGLPMLLRTILPTGLLGLMLTAYFSAIMSTADSCLMAASGNLVTDICGERFGLANNPRRLLRLSQAATLLIGAAALLLATVMENVLELMLHSYAFMVSGLLVPVIGGFTWRKASPTGALWAMIAGGCTTLILTIMRVPLPYGLDANVFGIVFSMVVFILLSLLYPRRGE